MTCERVEELLSALIDNDLDSRTRSAVDEHVHACPSCAETLRDLQLLIKTSSELELVDPPERLFFAIRREARRVQPRAWFAPRRIGWVLVPAVATVALMLVVFYPRSQPPMPMASQPPASVAAESPEPATLVPTPQSNGQAVASIPEPQPAARVIHRSRKESPAAGRIARNETRSPTLPVAAMQSPMPGSPQVVMAASVAPTGDAIDGLREIQQGLEEIEAAMHQNPGNPQVVRAYQFTYRKGVELRDRYVVGAR